MEKIEGKVIIVTNSKSGAYGWTLAEIFRKKIFKIGFINNKRMYVVSAD